MARLSGKKTKFVLNIKKLQKALAASEKTAAKSVVVGKKKVAQAKKSGDAKVLKANRDSLKGAKNARKKLGKAIVLMQQACCDQVFNCDPEFF